MKKITQMVPETPQEFIEHYTRQALDLTAQMQYERQKYGSAITITQQQFENACLMIGKAVIDANLAKLEKNQKKK